MAILAHGHSSSVLAKMPRAPGRVLLLALPVAALVFFMYAWSAREQSLINALRKPANLFAHAPSADASRQSFPPPQVDQRPPPDVPTDVRPADKPPSPPVSVTTVEQPTVGKPPVAPPPAHQKPLEPPLNAQAAQNTPATHDSAATATLSPALLLPRTPADPATLDADLRAMRSKMTYPEIWLDWSEVDLVLKYLRGVRTYLEWGSGGSTLNFPQFVSDRVVSIEHNKQWCEGMPARLEKKGVRSVEFRCVQVDHCCSEGTYTTYRKYVEEIGALNQANWDFVFIDGRARTSCAVRALSYVRNDSIVVVHDFERVYLPGESGYAKVLDFYDVVERIGNSIKPNSGSRGLAILRRKPRYSHLEGKHHLVQKMLEDGASLNVVALPKPQAPATSTTQSGTPAQGAADNSKTTDTQAAPTSQDTTTTTTTTQTTSSDKTSTPDSVTEPRMMPDPSTLESDLRAMRSKVTYSEVWLDWKEVDLVLKYLRGVRTYLEWGSGGSTLNFPQFVSDRVVSIEHNKKWCGDMPARLEKKGVRKVEYHCVEVDHCCTEGRYSTYRSYVDEINSLGQKNWDFVFIDGRARVSCAVRALSYLRDDSIVVVHDFERVRLSGEQGYARILDYYDVVERLGNSVIPNSGYRGIAALRRKKHLRHLEGRHDEVQQMLNDGTAKLLF